MISWQEICENPALKDLPYKIETNRFDQIVMSPSYLWHGGFQAKIANLLEKLMPEGQVITEAAVETTDGIKVPDVVWISRARLAPHRRAFSLPICPEICVEVLSTSNSQEEMIGKMKLYFEKGAAEVWLCDEDGKMEFFDGGGKLPESKICPAFPAKIDWD
jgi:Uma2 family endonuclease